MAETQVDLRFRRKQKYRHGDSLSECNVAGVFATVAVLSATVIMLVLQKQQ